MKRTMRHLSLIERSRKIEDDTDIGDQLTLATFCVGAWFEVWIRLTRSLKKKLIVTISSHLCQNVCADIYLSNVNGAAWCLISSYVKSSLHSLPGHFIEVSLSSTIFPQRYCCMQWWHIACVETCPVHSKSTRFFWSIHTTHSRFRNKGDLRSSILSSTPSWIVDMSLDFTWRPM